MSVNATYPTPTTQTHYPRREKANKVEKNANGAVYLDAG